MNSPKLCVVLIAVTLVLSALVALVLSIIITERKHSTYGCCTKMYSVLCKSLSMHPDDDFETFDKNKNLWRISVNQNGQYLCETEHITEIVDKFAEKQSRIGLAQGSSVHQYLSCGNRSLAKKTGDFTAYFNKILEHQNWTESSFQNKVHWKEHNFVDPRILCSNGEITIPESRIYFIYSSIIYSINKTDSKQHRLAMRICKRAYDYESTILGRTELFSGGERSVIQTSLQVGGQVFLRQGDVIFVRVSSMQGIKHESPGNTFGVFPL